MILEITSESIKIPTRKAMLQMNKQVLNHFINDLAIYIVSKSLDEQYTQTLKKYESAMKFCIKHRSVHINKNMVDDILRMCSISVTKVLLKYCKKKISFHTFWSLESDKQELLAKKFKGTTKFKNLLKSTLKDLYRNGHILKQLFFVLEHGNFAFKDVLKMRKKILCQGVLFDFFNKPPFFQKGGGYFINSTTKSKCSLFVVQKTIGLTFDCPFRKSTAIFSRETHFIFAISS